MKRPSANTTVAGLALCGLLLAGCAGGGNSFSLGGIPVTSNAGAGVEFVWVPLVLPSVVAVSAENAGASRFLMNVTVKNYMEKESPQVWMKMVAEYSNKDQQVCKQVKWFRTSKLIPGTSWTQAAYPVDTNSSCKCLKNECAGSVWLSLHPAQGSAERLPGSNTALLVSWVKDGRIQKMDVSEF